MGWEEQNLDIKGTGGVGCVRVKLGRIGYRKMVKGGINRTGRSSFFFCLLCFVFNVLFTFCVHNLPKDIIDCYPQ